MDACAATTLKGYVQSGRGGKWGVNKKEGRFQFRVPKSMGVFLLLLLLLQGEPFFPWNIVKL